MNPLYFPPALTASSTYFLLLSILLTSVIVIIGILRYRFFLWRYFALFFGVLFFEFLTSSLWITAHLGSYSYLNGDVSVIMTLFWVGIIFSMRFIYDFVCKKKHILKEYLAIVVGSSIFGLITIIILKDIGIFSYSPEMQKIIDAGMSIFGRPIEALVYFPTFIFVVYSFYKYWELAMYNKLYYLDYSVKPSWDTGIAIVIVMLIGYLMHPLLDATSPYSYFGLIFSMIFSLLLVNFTISFATHFSLFIRFLIGSILLSMLVSAFFSFFIEYGYIILSESLKINYTERTIMIPGFQFTDSEMVGILFFSYLLIANIKYFKSMIRHGNIEMKDGDMTYRGWKSLFH